MAGNIRIPKRVGAVKLPKKVRKKAKKAIKAATSPFVRDFATAAMAAAGRARRESDRPAEQEEQAMCQEFSVHMDGNKVADAFRKAAASGLRAFLEGLEEGLKEARADDPQPEPQAAAEPGPEPAPTPRPSVKARKPRPGAAKPGRPAPGA